MTESPKTSDIKSFATDVFAGAGLFVLVTTLVVGSESVAATLSLTDMGPASLALADASGTAHSMAVLGVVFSVLFAFNAAFFRHLGRAYTGTSRRK